MAEIAVTINNIPYSVGCDDGQESQVQDLGKYVNTKVEELKKTLGHIGENRLLVLAALKIADELGEAYNYIDKLEEQKSETLSPTTVRLAASKLDGLVASLETISRKVA